MLLSPENAPVNQPTKLDAGNYILVDVGDIVEEYFHINPHFRRPDKLMPLEINDISALEIELESLIPCLDSLTDASIELQSHCQDVQENAFDSDPDIIDQQDGTSVVVGIDPTIVLGYASSINSLGAQLIERFQQAGCYDAQGDLLGQFKAVYEGGILVLQQK